MYNPPDRCLKSVPYFPRFWVKDDIYLIECFRREMLQFFNKNSRYLRVNLEKHCLTRGQKEKISE